MVNETSLKKLYDLRSSFEVLNFITNSKRLKVHRDYESWYQNLSKNFKANPKILFTNTCDIKAIPEEVVFPLSRSSNKKLIVGSIDFFDHSLFPDEDIIPVIFHFDYIVKKISNASFANLPSKRYLCINGTNLVIEGKEHVTQNSIFSTVISSQLPFRGKIIKKEKDEELLNLLDHPETKELTIIPHIMDNKTCGCLVIWDKILSYDEVIEFI